ncbi:MAG: hypothetical protein R3C15_11460 [Thermoleophilia bacterium]
MSDESHTPEAPEADRSTSAAETPAAAVAVPEPGAPAMLAGLQAMSVPRGTVNLVYALLSLVAIGAIAALVIVLTRPGDPAAPPWSSFRPAGTGLAGAQEVADHVGTRYVLADGSPIVTITASDLTLGGSPIQGIVLRQQDTLGREQDAVVSPDGHVAFTLCGGGESCSIDAGTPSRARMQTLQYGALELALYSFRYLGATSVVAFLPPAPGTTPQYALFFQRQEMGPYVDAPLAATVPTRALTPDDLQPAEGEAIDAIVTPRTYRYDYAQPSGIPALVLSDPDLPEIQGIFSASAAGG